MFQKEAGLFCGSFPLKGEVFADGGLSQNLKDLKEFHLKGSRLFCGSFLRKGAVFACVGRNQNIKDLKRTLWAQIMIRDS